jgi:crotonobetainyl-CoA:carnitine CoA-transferase CaiB-like acyl-CoA transferase
MLAFPVRIAGETIPGPAIAPTAGEHTEEVLRDVLGYDAEKIEVARLAGAMGKPAAG